MRKTNKAQTEKKKTQNEKTFFTKMIFFSHRVVIDVVDKQELMFDNQRDTAKFLGILKH